MHYDNPPYNNCYDSHNSKRNNYYQNRYQDRSLRDHGPKPFVTNIHKSALHNNTFRTALWTGEYLQLTLMSIDIGDDIGLEMHPDLDQFLRIEQGQGRVMMGDEKNNLCYHQNVCEDYVIFVPAGVWHNLINTGNNSIKLYSIYAPPNHPHGTIHVRKEDDIH